MSEQDNIMSLLVKSLKMMMAQMIYESQKDPDYIKNLFEKYSRGEFD